MPNNKIKPKRSYTANAVPTTSDLDTNEIAIRWTAENPAMFTKNAAGNIVSITLGGGGGGGSANIVEAATAAGFPAGVVGTIYIATDSSRVYRFDASGFFIEIGPSGGSGSGSGGGGGSTNTAPAAPTGVTGVAGNAQIDLSWTAPASNGGSAITGYTVEYTPSGGPAQTVSTGGTGTTYTLSGLVNGTAYALRVAAVNAVGTGSFAAAASSVTPVGNVFRAIPAMTSNTAPSGAVIGETNGAGANGNADLWKAFDGSGATNAVFTRSPSNTPLRSLGYSFPAGQKSRISGYTIKPGFSGTAGYANYSAPNQWKFYGSDDGTTWELLDTRTGINPSGSQWNDTSVKSFTLASPANYQMYRWDWTYADANTGENEQIAAVQLTA